MFPNQNNPRNFRIFLLQSFGVNVLNLLKFLIDVRKPPRSIVFTKITDQNVAIFWNFWHITMMMTMMMMMTINYLVEFLTNESA